MTHFPAQRQPVHRRDSDLAAESVGNGLVVLVVSRRESLSRILAVATQGIRYLEQEVTKGIA